MTTTRSLLCLVVGVLGGCAGPRSSAPAPSPPAPARPGSGVVVGGASSPARPAARPSSELVSALLATDDRRQLESLVRELGERTLQDADVARLIEASRTDPSEAHRVFVRRALLQADTQPARDHLAEALLDPRHEAAAADVLSGLDRAPAGSVALLVRIYRETRSARLRDAVLGLASGGARRLYGYDDGNQRLLAAILEQPADERHRAEAVLASLGRGGAPRAGLFEDAREAFSATTDPQIRLRLIRSLAQSSPAETLVFALAGPMADAEARVAIDEFTRRASSDERLLTERPAVVHAVRRAAESPSPLQGEARIVRDLMLEAAVKDAVADAARQAASVTHGVARLSEQPGDRASRLVASWTSDTSAAFVESRLDALESTFGPLPDRAAARARLEGALEPARRALLEVAP